MIDSISGLMVHLLLKTALSDIAIAIVKQARPFSLPPAKKKELGMRDRSSSPN